MYDTILVPVDGSESSQYAAKHALDLASEVGATVHFLHVVSLNESRNVEVPRIEQGYLYQDLAQMGEEIIDDTISPLDEQEVPIKRTVMTGRPDKQILSFIQSERPDLVIMGSQGKTGLKRVVLGSVAENVARRSSIPIQLVQSPDDFVTLFESEPDEETSDQ